MPENSELYDLFSGMISQTWLIEPGARLAVVVYPSLDESPPKFGPGVVPPACAAAGTSEAPQASSPTPTGVSAVRHRRTKVVLLSPIDSCPFRAATKAASASRSSIEFGGEHLRP
jgi:hypothetical protein